MKAFKWLAVAALFCAACASAGEPTGQLASATAAVRAAQELGAQTVPQAELHLQLAREQIDRAQRLIKDDEMEEADLSLKRATADAELAVAITRAATARRDALDAERKSNSQSSTELQGKQQSSQVVTPSSDVRAAR